MLVMSCQGVARGFSGTPLFEDVSFELFHGQRVGFVAPNGAGKTTLLKILVGLDTPDAGDVTLHAGAKASLLRQQAEFPAGRTLFDEAKSAFDELVEAQNEMVAVAEKMADAADGAERQALSDRFDRLNELLANQGAYSVDHKVAEVLGGLRFTEGDYGRGLNSFSGGQQRRALLAKMLLAGPDVLLLDEPTNHLDIHAVRWLEEYLVRQPQAMMVVSHDRYFLNKVTNKTFELHDRSLTQYPGNFDQYVRLREDRYQLQMKEYESQKEYIEKQEEYIRRTHYGQLAKQAQSRQKQLDKIEHVEKPTRVEGPRMHFADGLTRTGDVVFRAEDVSKSFGGNALFEKLSFAVQRGQRLGIMGPNGCGKTTLLKILLGREPASAGKVETGHLVNVGYLDQHLKMLPDDETVLRAVWPDPDPDLTAQKMRDLLGRFGLVGDKVEQKVGLLSGGERSRAALAKLVVEEANVLVLDEPTNHLDIWACESLENALKAYEGTAVVVSHDRYLLNRTVDVLIVFEDGKVQVVYGNYDTYELLRAAQQAGTKPAEKKSTKGESSTTARPAKAGKRKRRFPYREVDDLEADIASGEEHVAKLEADMVAPETYRDPEKMKETMAAFEAAKEKLQTLYEHWEEAIELN